MIKKHLAPGGRIVIAIENKYGLKYFAGCKEDHLGTYFPELRITKRAAGYVPFQEKVWKNSGILRRRKISFLLSVPGLQIHDHPVFGRISARQGRIIK